MTNWKNRSPLHHGSIIFILVSVIIFSMAACGGSRTYIDDGLGELPPAGNGSMPGGNTPTIYDTLNTAYSGPGFQAACLLVNNNPRQLLTTLFPGGISVTVVSSSSVSFTLKEPQAAYQFNWTDWPMWPPQMLSGLSVSPSDAKGFGMSSFLETDNKTCKELGLRKGNDSGIYLVWADKDVKVSFGPAKVGQRIVAINLDLKAGWNTVIEKWTGSRITNVSGPATGSHWAIRDQEN
jgi:hypothetical protein